MKKFVKDNKWIIAIIFIALIVRIIFLISVKPWGESYMEKQFGSSDSKEYDTLAKLIVEKGSYPENVYLDLYRTPVFPLYAALLYFIFGVKPFIILLSHIFLNIVSIVFIYLICKKLFDNIAIALIASLLYTLEPNIIKLVTEFGTETLHAMLLIISVYCFIVGLKDKKNIFIIVSAVFFAVTALTRPVSLYFYALCILFILFYPGEKIKQKIIYSILFVAVYVITITPWMYRNYSIYGYFSTNAFQGNQMMYNAGVTRSFETGMSADSAHLEFLIALNKICEENKISNPFEIEKQKQNIGYNYIVKHLDLYTKLQLKGMMNFFISPLNNPKYGLKSKIFISVYLFLIYFICLYGVYLLIKKKQFYYLLFLLLTVFYFCAWTGILGISRYRTPTTAFYLIITAYGAYYLFINIKNKIKINRT